MAEKIRSAIEHAEMPVIGSLTASVGVASLPEDAVESEQLVRRADRALYAAKARGRNRVESAVAGGFNAKERRGGPEDPLGGDSWARAAAGCSGCGAGRGQVPGGKR